MSKGGSDTCSSSNSDCHSCSRIGLIPLLADDMESTSSASWQLNPTRLRLKNRTKAAVIGPEGGVLNLYGVSLNIPRGALVEREIITLGIIRNQPTTLEVQLTGGETILSPIVCCEPHGLHFEKPVELTLPHCANGRDWQFAVWKSETELHEEEAWVEVASTDSDLKINDTYVHVQIDHFTNWALTGMTGTVKESSAITTGFFSFIWAFKEYLMPSSKMIRLVAYTPTRGRSRDIFRIYVCCLNDYPGNLRVSRST